MNPPANNLVNFSLKRTRSENDDNDRDLKRPKIDKDVEGVFKTVLLEMEEKLDDRMDLDLPNDYFSDLPKDARLQIFNWLDLKALEQCRLISKQCLNDLLRYKITSRKILLIVKKIFGLVPTSPSKEPFNISNDLLIRIAKADITSFDVVGVKAVLVKISNYLLQFPIMNKMTKEGLKRGYKIEYNDIFAYHQQQSKVDHQRDTISTAKGKVLALCGDFAGANAELELIQSPFSRNRVYKAIAKAQLKAGDKKGAEKITDLMLNDLSKAKVIAARVKYLAKTREMQAAETLINQIDDVIKKYEWEFQHEPYPSQLPPVDQEKTMALGVIVQEKSKDEDWEGAQQTLDKIDFVFKHGVPIKQVKAKFEAILALAKSKAIAGDKEGAQQTFELAKALVKPVDIHLRHNLRLGVFLTKCLRKLASVQAEYGFMSEAENTAKEISSVKLRVLSLTDLAQLKVKNQDLEGAKSTFDLAIKNALKIVELDAVSESCEAIVKALRECKTILDPQEVLKKFWDYIKVLMEKDKARKQKLKDKGKVDTKEVFAIRRYLEFSLAQHRCENYEEARKTFQLAREIILQPLSTLAANRERNDKICAELATNLTRMGYLIDARVELDKIENLEIRGRAWLDVRQAFSEKFENGL